jgi:hypothetical protein
MAGVGEGEIVWIIAKISLEKDYKQSNCIRCQNHDNDEVSNQ